jgi:hypothetical protein
MDDSAKTFRPRPTQPHEPEVPHILVPFMAAFTMLVMLPFILVGYIVGSASYWVVASVVHGFNLTRRWDEQYEENQKHEENQWNIDSRLKYRPVPDQQDK